MKTNPLRSFSCWVILSLIVPSLVPIQSVEAQGGINKRKGGLGRLFRKSSAPITALPVEITENPTRPPKKSVIPTDGKSIALKTHLMSVIPNDRHYRETLADAIVIAYHSRRFKSIWNHREMPPQLRNQLGAQLVRHGLPAVLSLNPESIAGVSRRAPVHYRDLGFTVAIFDAALLVRLGAIAPEEIWPNWNKGDRPGEVRTSAKDVAQEILRAASSPVLNVELLVDSMASRNWIYRELQNGYTKSRRASGGKGIAAIPDPAIGGLARPGQPYAHAHTLAENLAALGYLDMPSDQRRALQSVTPELAFGIKAFQSAHDLTADGIMGAGTWLLLNNSEAARYQTRVINLHRSRLLPDEMGERYVIVNLPSAELYGFENGNHVMTMNIVHGKNDKESTQTPVFRDVMTDVAFAPYWNVPESISTKEIYPKLLEDSTYLERNQYELVQRFTDDAEIFEPNEENLAKIETGEIWLRQRPTAGNALGKVKFLLPNQFHIYLHDTPSKHFFTMDNRAQSHGCIRLASPPKMAIWTLAKQGWKPEQILEALNSERQVMEKLETPVNVYVTYFTSFPRPVGIASGQYALGAAWDVYGKDAPDAEKMVAILP